MCPRHQQAAPDPRVTTTIQTWAAPDLATAHHAHQRFLRHPRASTAWTAARAITTRWYDHQQHLTHRWHTRLTQLCATNPHLTTAGSVSPALLTRDLVIYPETVDLARALATLPNRPQRTTNDALTLIARRLGLARLTPSANDPLRVFLTHTRTDQPKRTPKPTENAAAYKRTTTSTGNPRSFPHNYRTAGQAPEQANRTRHQATPSTPDAAAPAIPSPTPKGGTPDPKDQTP
ncbi:hypothetical protein [Streptomyces antimycoticus]